VTATDASPELWARLPPGDDAEQLLDGFLGWVSARGLTLYPAQEEAILELMGDSHVVLETPTGSGKSLVAIALCFQALGTGQTAYYTCPIKALVSEKFFELCKLFGPERVGMLTGDASINRDAPIICCTAEILANIALGEGEDAPVDQVVMDEFHYYADPERGMAWQLPLLTLRHARFLLMSATMGDVTPVMESLRELTGREVKHVRGNERPVPLEMTYGEKPLHQTIVELAESGKAPVYVVSFTQRECAELAQGLTGFALGTREQRQAIQQELHGVRFDSPYGPDLKRMLGNAIGLHHAGLLPKYRRVVERLAQLGLLRVICGTDTLGVGVNIPLRTVLLTQLCKYDGDKSRLLTSRELKQIAGRAGRKGFDDRGYVVCQAPAHAIENRQLEDKAGDDPKKRRRIAYKKPPEKGYVAWERSTFERLVQSSAEPLVGRFQLSHGLLLNLLQRDPDQPSGYRALIQLIAVCHERDASKKKLRRLGKQLFVSLRNAEVISVTRRPGRRGAEVRVATELQHDFSLDRSLSLFVLEALDGMDPESESYALDVLSLIEATLEHPKVVLFAQERKLKDELIGRLKAEGVEYEERMAELEKVSYPKPNAEQIYALYNEHAKRHPWLELDNVRPKGIVREMFEGQASFTQFVKELGLRSAEGVLLRYLSQAYRALIQTVPESKQTDEVLDIAAYLRALLQRVDSSLLQEWEAMRAGGGEQAEPAAVAPPRLTDDPKRLRARLRAEMHQLLQALASGDYAEAAACVRGAGAEDGATDEADAAGAWDEARLAASLAPYLEAHGRLRFDARARFADRTLIDEPERHLFRIRQLFGAPDEDGDTVDDWYLEATVDLRVDGNPEGPLLQVTHLGP
jgi:superfamily II RNA helicase